MLLFCVTVFLSAFLLFQVQPLIGKFILPWFGSSPGVWATCMLFFQVLLLGGYAYAHLVVSRLSPRRQGWTHLCLLGLALLALPITPSEAWKPGPEDQPIVGILLVLAASVGAPFFLLSSTGPLLQGWFARLVPGRSPYRLYALSNAGSVLALVSYPFVVERFMPLREQTTGWSWFYALFALSCGACAWTLLRRSPAAVIRDSGAVTRGPERIPTKAFDVQLWVLLSACGSALLLATTNQLIRDVAAVPFLWILPLSLYLLTFILCFESERWYRRPFFCALLPLALINAVRLLDVGLETGISDQILGYSAALFVCCMCCHGELARLKPVPSQLTYFFLMVSLGGALGGFFVAIVAPLVFAGIYEYHLLLVASYVLVAVAAARSTLRRWAPPGECSRRIASRICWFACAAFLLYGVGLHLVDAGWIGDDFSTLTDGRLRWLSTSRYLAAAAALAMLSFTEWLRLRREVPLTEWWRPPRLGLFAMGLAVCLGLVSLAGILGWQVFGQSAQNIRMDRNFYGMLTIEEYSAGAPEGLALSHGRILHGFQLRSFPNWPTSYYGPESGVGIAISHHPLRDYPDRGFRVGVVGLGTGTVAAYANASIDRSRGDYARPEARRQADYVRYYEINPMVRDWADEHFTFLADARRRGADVEVFMGDARLVMERQLEDGEAQEFDVLAIDAFSSDAIPIHLLTAECLEIYWKHLRPDGILAFHVSNRFVELVPIVRRLGEGLGKAVVRIVNEEDEIHGVDDSDWVLITSNWAFLQSKAVIEGTQEMPPVGPLWTDDFSSLFEVLDTSW